MKQLRIYTLKDKNAASEYFQHHWMKHLSSLPKFGIAINDVYLGADNNADKVMAIVTYPKDSIPKELDKKYMQSDDFKADMVGFDLSNIIKVDEFWISDRLF
ncbi:hypothetical protein SJI19_22265 [Acerihabitans sp. TG2]|uniref:hypothetical protein n=1 Tax=Acerihabitans sp. TG2 TaxID=3096008 RepID=UPI002B222EAF|nr:hypothetical protein [Acerihabitans sp. TG2]MEA9393230.1 hypothetical protein [Acerihabitans sp. TG2]